MEEDEVVNCSDEAKKKRKLRTVVTSSKTKVRFSHALFFFCTIYDVNRKVKGKGTTMWVKFCIVVDSELCIVVVWNLAFIECFP